MMFWLWFAILMVSCYLSIPSSPWNYICLFVGAVFITLANVCYLKLKRRIELLEIEVHNTRSFKRNVIDFIDHHATYVEEETQ